MIRLSKTPAHLKGESAIQANIVLHIRRFYPHITVYFIDNGANTKMQRIRKTAMGMMAGVPDLHLIWKGGHAYIEVKNPATPWSKAGTQNKAQKDFQRLCNLLNIPYNVSRSVEDAEKFLKTLK